MYRLHAGLARLGRRSGRPGERISFKSSTVMNFSSLILRIGHGNTHWHLAVCDVSSRTWCLGLNAELGGDGADGAARHVGCTLVPGNA